MPLPIIAGAFRVTFDWEAPNRIAENVIHILAGGADSADVLDAVFTSLESDMWQCVSSDYRIASISCTPLDGSLLTSVLPVVDTGAYHGQGGGEYIPNASALVKHTTQRGGRSGRGRTYLPGLAEDRTSDGMTAPAQRDLTTAAWQQFQVNLLANDPEMAFVVASYTQDFVSVVTNSTCEAPIATQRRRNKRVA